MSEEKCNYYWDGVCRCMDSSINQDFYKEPMCCDVSNCYFKQNKRLHEALELIANTGHCTCVKDAKQALGE